MASSLNNHASREILGDSGDNGNNGDRAMLLMDFHSFRNQDPDISHTDNSTGGTRELDDSPGGLVETNGYETMHESNNCVLSNEDDGPLEPDLLRELHGPASGIGVENEESKDGGPGIVDFEDSASIVSAEVKDEKSDEETEFDTDFGDWLEIYDLDNHHVIFIHGKPRSAVNRKRTARASTNASSFKPTTLNGLLTCPQAPGQGLCELEDALKEDERAVIRLKQEMHSLAATLKEAEDIYDKACRYIDEEKEAFHSLHIDLGISNNLWTEYEAFCKSLEPRRQSLRGWSATFLEDHRGSYVGYDPDLELFKELSEMTLGARNFRCEPSTIDSRGRLNSKHSKEYVVEFWPLDRPIALNGEKNWGELYPELYRLAHQAANDPTRPEPGVATELLKSLPAQNASFVGGWLFEYHQEPARAGHFVESRRWSYRSAHRIEDTEGGAAEGSVGASEGMKEEHSNELKNEMMGVEQLNTLGGDSR